MITEREKSRLSFVEATKYIPGGVNSPVRAFKAVEGDPVFIEKASGAYVYDLDGNRYLDFIGSWGPAILGHSHPEVIKALEEAISRGFSFGMSSPLETELAKLISSKILGAEMVRFVNSGTEAAMTAIRLARAFSGRNKIIKFEGCYHGHSDGLLVRAGSGGATFGVPTSPGVPSDCTKNTITLPYNDTVPLESVFSQEEIAGVIVEPVAGNMGVIIPRKKFIQRLKSLCRDTGSVLIFDEVMTGFRIHEQGAQGYFGIGGDLICLGKIIGGGLPVGAVAGKREIMSKLAPQGEVYQAGTLSGNPLAMTAGLKTLEIFYRESIMRKINFLSHLLKQGLEKIKREHSDVSFSVLGGMFTLFFTSKTPQNFEDVQRCDFKKFGQFFKFMLDHGILLPPSQFEANFISAAHTEDNISEYVLATKKFLAERR
ncbi:MAG: glutamate-1-semialdehyde 2,1-aminomutase [Candidatus Aminicenantales bacterium]